MAISRCRLPAFSDAVLPGRSVWLSLVCLALGLMLKCFATRTATETQAVNSCKLGYFDIKGEWGQTCWELDTYRQTFSSQIKAVVLVYLKLLIALVLTLSLLNLIIFFLLVIVCVSVSISWKMECILAECGILLELVMNVSTPHHSQPLTFQRTRKNKWAVESWVCSLDPWINLLLCCTLFHDM